MKKLLVICGAGMTSSILVSKMRSYVQQDGTLDYKIGSCAVNQIDQYVPQADVVFIAPHLSYITTELVKKHPEKVILNIPVEMYGNLDGAGVIHLMDKKEESVKHISIITWIARRIGGSRYLRSIMLASSSLMPVLIIGSIFTLANNFPYQPYLQWIDGTMFSKMMVLGSYMTTNCVSLYMTFLVAYHYGSLCHVSPPHAGINALMCYFLLMNPGIHSIDMTYFGANGMFCAFITAFGSVELFAALDHVCQRFGEKIKSLPHAIYNSFLSLIPGFVSVIFFSLISGLFVSAEFSNFPDFVYKVLQIRLSGLIGDHIVSFMITQLAAHLLWFVGIHGGQVVRSVTGPVLLPLAIENVTAFQAGQSLPHIIHSQFSYAYTFGGAGSTLSLAFLMFFFAKSQQLKQLGKISLPMGIFFINEPIILGLPIMMNPLMFFPFVLIPVGSSLLTYLVMRLGIVPLSIGFELPWTTPFLISGMIQGGWRLALWQLIMFFLQMAVWFPFFHIQDKRYLKDEQASEVLPR